MSDNQALRDANELSAKLALAFLEKTVREAVEHALGLFPDDAAWRARVSEVLRRVDPLGSADAALGHTVRLGLLPHAQAFVKSFEDRFSALPDLDNEPDASLAAGVQAVFPQLKGVSWEDWSRAVYAVAWARKHQVRS